MPRQTSSDLVFFGFQDHQAWFLLSSITTKDYRHFIVVIYDENIILLLLERLLAIYSDKMVKVEPKQISLTDKLIETRNNKRTVNIIYRGELETTTWPEINKLADLYATVLIEQKMTMKTCAMIGQYSKEAFAQYVACILTGNTVLMLEPDFPDRFDIMDETETELVIIDKKYLTGKYA